MILKLYTNFQSNHAHFLLISYNFFPIFELSYNYVWFFNKMSWFKLLAAIEWLPYYFHYESFIQKWLKAGKLHTMLPPIQLKLLSLEYWFPFESLLNSTGGCTTLPPLLFIPFAIYIEISLKFILPPANITLLIRS